MVIDPQLTNDLEYLVRRFNRLLGASIEYIMQKLTQVDSALAELIVYINGLYERYTPRIQDNDEREIPHNVDNSESSESFEDPYNGTVRSSFIVNSTYVQIDNDSDSDDSADYDNDNSIDDDITYPAVGDLAILSDNEDDDDDGNVLYFRDDPLE